MNEKILDLGELIHPRPEIELLDDEARALLTSPRCPKCNHLGVFHYWEWVAEVETNVTRIPKMDMKVMSCKFCPEACAIERV